jgi:uncharacterized protein (TIGR02172 family)
MDNVNEVYQDGALTIALSGHVDTNNAPQVEQAVNGMLEAHPKDSVIIDMEKLEYISSAGLRIILRVRKAHPELRIINVSSEIYDILEMTGFTEMITVEKAYKRVSVEGCETIGEGSNGKVYRLDAETIIKVYKNPDSLPDIKRERELARKAFVLGIPTAIPYGVVKVGDSYGSVFELLSAQSFSKLIVKEPENADKYIGIYVDLLKKIHGTELKKGEMPDMKEVTVGRTEFLKDYLPSETYEKLHSLISDVPDNNHMLHGDYHTNNVMLQNGEVLLIDMDTLCLGDPIFEFASIYLGYLGFSEIDHNVTMSFLGLPYETCRYIWDETLRLYFGTEDKELLASIEKKAIIVGQLRLLRRTIKRLGNTEEGKRQIELSRKHLIELVPQVDSLSLA